jgi:hypothetical protein
MEAKVKRKRKIGVKVTEQRDPRVELKKRIIGQREIRVAAE